MKDIIDELQALNYRDAYDPHICEKVIRSAIEEIRQLRAEIKLVRSVSGFVEVNSFRDITKELRRNEPKAKNG